MKLAVARAESDTPRVAEALAGLPPRRSGSNRQALAPVRPILQVVRVFPQRPDRAQGGRAKIRFGSIDTPHTNVRLGCLGQAQYQPACVRRANLRVGASVRSASRKIMVEPDRVSGSGAGGRLGPDGACDPTGSLDRDSCCRAGTRASRRLSASSGGDKQGSGARRNTAEHGPPAAPVRSGDDVDNGSDGAECRLPLARQSAPWPCCWLRPLLSGRRCGGGAAPPVYAPFVAVLANSRAVAVAAEAV